MLILIGHMHANPEDMSDFVAEARAMAPLVRAAPGNLFFACVQDEDVDGAVLLVERWVDRASLDAHVARLEVVAFLDRWNGRFRYEVSQFEANDDRAPR